MKLASKSELNSALKPPPLEKRSGAGVLKLVSKPPTGSRLLPPAGAWLNAMPPLMVRPSNLGCAGGGAMGCAGGGAMGCMGGSCTGCGAGVGVGMGTNIGAGVGGVGGGNIEVAEERSSGGREVGMASWSLRWRVMTWHARAYWCRSSEPSPSRSASLWRHDRTW